MISQGIKKIYIYELINLVVLLYAFYCVILQFFNIISLVRGSCKIYYHLFIYLSF